MKEVEDFGGYSPSGSPLREGFVVPQNRRIYELAHPVQSLVQAKDPLAGRLARAIAHLTLHKPNLPRYKDLLKNIDWAFAPLPAGPFKSATVVGGEYLAIFKQSEHPDAAWKFLKWMIQPEIQAFWSFKSGYLPIRHAVLNVPEFQKYLDENPNFKVFVEQMEVGQAQRPIDYGGLEISRHLAEAIENATTGNADAKKSLDESATKSNKMLTSSKK